MHRLGSIQVQYQTVLETSVFCRLKMAIIPAEVGVCSWNSTARRHPMDAAAAILKIRRKSICFIFISVLPKIIVRIFILAYTVARSK